MELLHVFTGPCMHAVVLRTALVKPLTLHFNLHKQNKNLQRTQFHHGAKVSCPNMNFRFTNGEVDFLVVKM